MTPNLKTLGMGDFIDFLDNIKLEMRSKPNQFNEELMIKQLHPIFQNLITMLDQKISGISLADDQ
jgi:hypothetical protein